MSFIDSDETYYDSEEDFEPSNEEPSEEVSDTFLDNFDVFPITAHRQKYIIRIKDYEYY